MNSEMAVRLLLKHIFMYYEYCALIVLMFLCFR